MKSWETNNVHELFELLAGDWYGPNPEEKLDLLRHDKTERAKFLCQDAGLKKDMVVLELGSGIGFASRHIASAVKQLACCDISESFLSYARKECADVPNISFHKLGESPELSFPAATFDAVIADAVFIHLNLFDIYWYFAEFAKVMKSDGTVWINIMNDAIIVREKVVENAELYRKDRESLKTLLCWNSIAAVVEIAGYSGFSLIAKQPDGVNLNLRFRKQG